MRPPHQQHIKHLLLSDLIKPRRMVINYDRSHNFSSLTSTARSSSIPSRSRPRLRNNSPLLSCGATIAPSCDVITPPFTTSTPPLIRQQQQRRSLSSIGNDDGNGSHVVAFDRNIKQYQRDGAARSHALALSSEKTTTTTNNGDDDDDYVDYDYVYDEIAMRLVDRLDDIRMDGGFPLALEIGSGAGYLHRAICSDDALEGEGGMGGIRKLVQLDSSEGMLHRDDGKRFPGSERCETFRMVGDEEGTLPFPDGTFDVVLSSVALHRLNDLPGLFREVKRVLKDDGCFMFAMIGGSTLPELRSSLVLAEMERDGGVSPHVGPFVDFSDVGSLLTGAGFTLPTVDIDTITVGYPDAMVLMEHLQRMGEGNACVGRRERVSRDTFVAAAAIYRELYGVEEKEEEGEDSVRASFQVIYAIGWTPHESQQKPKERGSADRKLEDMVEHFKNN